VLGDYQKYEVTVRYTYEAEVFPEDPDDVFDLAKLEETSVATQLSLALPDLLEIRELTVAPVIGE
jgi:hypothetical protein